MISRLFLLFSDRCPPAHSPTDSFGTTPWSIYNIDIVCNISQMRYISHYLLGEILITNTEWLEVRTTTIVKGYLLFSL